MAKRASPMGYTPTVRYGGEYGDAPLPSGLQNVKPGKTVTVQHQVKVQKVTLGVKPGDHSVQVQVGKGQVLQPGAKPRKPRPVKAKQPKLPRAPKPKAPGKTTAPKPRFPGKGK